MPDNPLPTEVQVAWDAYREMGRDEEAMAYYWQAVRVKPLATDVRYKLADLYLAKGEEKKALEQYKATADLDVTNIAAHYRLAEHYEGIRDWKNAQRQYLTILAVDDDHSLGTLLRRTLSGMKPIEAMEGLIRQMAKFPSNPSLLDRIGQAREQNGA